MLGLVSPRRQDRDRSVLAPGAVRYSPDRKRPRQHLRRFRGILQARPATDPDPEVQRFSGLLHKNFGVILQEGNFICFTN